MKFDKLYKLLQLDEALPLIEEGLKDFGLKLHRKTGLIQYLLKSGKFIRKFIIAGFKKDTKTIKKLMIDIKKKTSLIFYYN